MTITARSTHAGRRRYMVQVRRSRVFDAQGIAEAWALHGEGAVLAEFASEPHLLPRRVHRQVEQLPDGWRARVAATRTFDRRRDAERWKVRVEDAIDHHRGPGIQADRTLAQAIDVYKASPAWRDLAPRTQAKRELRLEWWRKRRGHLPLAALSPGLLADDRDALAAGGGPSGRPLSNSTVYKYLTNLSRVLEHVRRERQWIEVNPARIIQRPSVAAWAVTPILTDGDVEALLAACEASEDRRLLPMVLLSLSSGARASELQILQRQDVDLVAGTGLVRRTKAGPPRVLRWHGRAREELVRYLEVPSITGAIFPDLTDSRPYPRQAWDAARKASCVQKPWKSMRATAATWLAQLGASEHEIMFFLGHGSPAMARHYVHLGQGLKSDIGPTLVRRLLAA